MHWVKDYYTQQSETFGRPVVTEHNRQTATRLDGWCRERGCGKQILELASGAGGLAAAMADLGYDVWAVEFNPSDAAFARELAGEDRKGAVHVVTADFYEVDLGRTFDFIYYWDGFGVGSDDDQRRLLRRIGTEWLTERGTAVLDVFSPWNWLKRVGDSSTYTARDGIEWRRTIDFDTVGQRLLDRWHPVDDPGTTRSQSIRCYSIPDLVMLLDGTGLRLDRVLTMDGTPIDPAVVSAEASGTLATTNGYFAIVTGDEETAP